jgi:hypothetical protein
MRARKFADLVNEVQDRIDDFERAQQAVERARGALVNAEVELGNAKTRLDASRDRLFEECPELRPAGIPDAELAAFKVQPIPEVDQWTRREAVRTVRDLEALRTQVLAKSEALVPNEDGTIALTKTQLAEFFGL